MKRTLALSALLGTFAAPVAYAAGPTVVQADPVPMAPIATPIRTRDFTGFSMGAQVGYGYVDTEDAGGADGEDLLIGLRAYYDYDFGGYILGGGIQYDATDIELDGVADVDAVLRAGVRGGIDYNSEFFYGTAGYAKAFTDDDAVSLGDSNGYFLGLGVETFVTDNITIGAEVLYHQFNDFDIDDVEADATTASVNMNYRF